METNGSYNGAAALGSPVHNASERNKAMNSRVDSYFESLPENVADARGKRGNGGWGTLGRADEADADVEVRRGSASTTSSGSAPRVEAVADKASSAWRRAKTKSKDMTSFFR